MGRRAGTPWARAVGVVALIGIASSALASGAEAQGSWSEVAPMPTARLSLAAGVVDGKLYALGGLDSDENASDTVEVYDPATRTWATVAPMVASMPTARSSLAAGVVAGKLYALGGFDSDINAFDTVEVYDPATDTWAAVAPMPTARGGLAAGVVAGKLYALGGLDSDENASHTVEVYDPATRTWAAVAPMPTARSSLAAGVVAGKLYALGGFDDAGTLLDTVDMYDPATDTWARVAPMPTARSDLAAGVVGGKLYALGGLDSSKGVQLEKASDTVNVYDPAMDTWAAVAPMPTARYTLAAGVVDGKLYAVGGYDDDDDDDLPVDTVEMYDPAKDTTSSPSSPKTTKTTVAIGAAAGGVALLASVAAAIVIKRRRALYRQQAARLTMARGSASPSLASV